MNYDGDNYKIITNKNINKAEIKGFSLNCVANFSKFWKLNYTFNYTNGKNITQNLPMGHIPPIFGKFSIIYKNKLFLYEINCFYNGEKNIKVFSPFGEDNQTQATKNGYPSWRVYNLNKVLMKKAEILFNNFPKVSNFWKVKQKIFFY